MTKFELEEYHRNVPDTDLINDVIHVAKKFNLKTLTKKAYKDNGGKFGENTFLRRFGTWHNVLFKAGLERSKNYNTSIEELFRNLEEIWIKKGRQPRRSAVVKPFSKYDWRTYVYHFGSWRKTLEKFIEYVNQEEISESRTNDKIVTVDNTHKKAELKHKTKRDISWRLRFIIMKQDNFKCRNCGRSPATEQRITLHVDHIVPYSKGGETVSDNLQTLCSMCNIGKSDLE